MSNHTFRNPHLFQQLKFRDWIREKMPNGSQGFVVEDLDLVTRVYGRHYGADDIGKFRLIEIKHKTHRLGCAQEKTFGLMDALARIGDPHRQRYDGYYLIQADSEDWDECMFFHVNGEPLPRDKFMAWFEFDPSVQVEPYDFKHPLLRQLQENIDRYMPR